MGFGDLRLGADFQNVDVSGAALGGLLPGPFSCCAIPHPGRFSRIRRPSCWWPSIYLPRGTAPKNATHGIEQRDHQADPQRFRFVGDKSSPRPVCCLEIPGEFDDEIEGPHDL